MARIRVAIVTAHCSTERDRLLFAGRLELPGKIGKKEASLKQNTNKVEALLYDLSVVKSSGGGGGGGGGGGDGAGD